MPRSAFTQIVNRSMSEVLTRSLATTFCTLLPIIALLLFGGETLKDFAFALMIGVASGAYSSIFIASPVLTHWKEREAVYASRRQRIIGELGAVPAYAVTAAGTTEDVEPEQKRKRSRRGTLLSAEEAGEQLSRDEFQELVADLDVDKEPPSRPQRQGAQPAARQRKGTGSSALADEPKPATDVASAAEAEDSNGAPKDPAADLTPEDLVMKEDPKPRPQKRRTRNKRHGRPR